MRFNSFAEKPLLYPKETGSSQNLQIIIFHMITASGASPLISLANIGRLDLQKTIGESV